MIEMRGTGNKAINQESGVGSQRKQGPWGRYLGASEPQHITLGVILNGLDSRVLGPGQY